MGRLGNQRTAGGGVLLQKGLISRYFHQQSAGQSPGIDWITRGFFLVRARPQKPLDPSHASSARRLSSNMTSTHGTLKRLLKRPLQINHHVLQQHAVHG